MTIAIGFWSQELIPGKEEAIIPITDLKISNVALGETLVDPNGRSTIKITYSPPGSSDLDDEDEDEESPEEITTVLCSLTAGKLEHTTTDIVLEKDEQYIFTVVGKNSVFLSGNYIDQAGVDNPPYGESDFMESEDEDDLDEIDSDIDVGHDEELTDASRFEEVAEVSPKGLKRAREPDVTFTDKEKARAEKKNKKLKGENGQAVAVESGKKDNEKVGSKEKAAEMKSEGKGEQPKEKKKEKKEKQEKQEKPGKEAKSERVEKELPGGLKILDVVAGSGPAAKKGNRVSMRYIGKLQNGKIFDKNVKGKPFTFRLGQGEVIKGWDEGIVGMHAGGERKLTIPAPMGYGKKGTDGIPANSTLLFEVKLLEIK
ncbi:hypothetical protein AX15_006796 [Amanita polypyramis BW_CC]|nr:hypothetical protein AX15_006796 [Amanita polypyramis BW_CC]